MEFEPGCSSTLLFEILSNLTDAHKKSVREIDFGGLLSMRFKSFPVSLIPWLLERFDADARLQTISDLKYHITAEDVHDIFPLPRYSGK